uniref:Orf34b n=1 Tax=Picea abies TaxID=3329 RepID=O62962_PICAB|nr:orf34b [Picea abies]
MFAVILHPSSHSINNGYVQFSCIQQELNPRVHQL